MSITSIPHPTCPIPSNSTYRTGVLHPSKTGSFLLPSEVHSSSMISAQCLLSSYLPMTVTSLNKGSQAFAFGSSRHQRCISHILLPYFSDFINCISSQRLSSEHHGSVQGEVHEDICGKLWAVFKGWWWTTGDIWTIFTIIYHYNALHLQYTLYSCIIWFDTCACRHLTWTWSWGRRQLCPPRW